jgi:tripeptide aminopeptidase
MRADPVELFIELVQIPSPPGEEGEVLSQVVEFARARGLDPIEDASAASLGGNAGNLLLSLPSTRAGGVPICFCAHLDTIPTSGQIRPQVSDGMIRSDGTTILGADNKASVAAMLTALDTVIREERPHAGVEVLLTPMEEVGCCGAKAFDFSALAAHVGFVYDHAAPVGAYVSSAPAGYLARLAFHGRPAHAGIAPENGRSAIEAAALTLAGLDLGRLDGGATMNVGTIEGGTAHNVVPDLCSLVVDIRARDSKRGRELVDGLLAIAAAAAESVGCTVSSEIDEKYVDYAFSGNEPVVRMAEAALGRVGATPVALSGGGGADANVFNAAGLPCLNLGNGMEMIHTTEERIEVAELERCVDLSLALIEVAANWSPDPEDRR